MKSDSGQIGIVVAGMHRSGTSAVTGCLAELGIPLGRDLLMPGEDNPKGYFENERAVRIDDALLDALDRRWDDVRGLPEKWVRSQAAAAARKEIAAFVQDEFAGSPVFAVKDPRLSRLLPVWLTAFGDANVAPRVVLVVRHPSEVAGSIQRRNGWFAAVSELLWLRHMLAAERDSRGIRRAAVTYDQLTGSPLPTISDVLESLGVAIAAERGALREFVSPENRHFESGRGTSSGTRLTEIAVEAYFSFSAMAEGEDVDPGIFDGYSAELERTLRPNGGLLDALGSMNLVFRRDRERALTELDETRARLNAQIAWSEQAVIASEDLNEQLAEARSSLNAQLEWSEQAVIASEDLNGQLAEARSSLNAQLEWSESAVLERERLVAHLADVNSRLEAQLSWSDHAVQERERLSAELANTRSDLIAQLEWSDQAVADRESLNADLAKTRSDLNAQIEWSNRAVEERERLYARLAEAGSELNVRTDESERLKKERDALEDRLVEAQGASLAERGALEARLGVAQAEIEALCAAVAEADSSADLLRARIERYESSLFGRLNMKWTNRNPGNNPDNRRKN